MKKLTGLNDPIVDLDGKPIGDLVAGRLLADAVFASRDTTLALRMHRLAQDVFAETKLTGELDVEDQDYDEAKRIIEEADFPVVSKAVVLSCFQEISV